MKTNLIFKIVAVVMVFVLSGLTVHARSYEGNLIYNVEEQGGIKTGQTVYKMKDGTLDNYMKYHYDYDDSKRMTESQMMKWNANSSQWEKDLRITYTYTGKQITTHYYKWNKKTNQYVMAEEMTTTVNCPN